MISWNFFVLIGRSGESDGTRSGCDLSAALSPRQSRFSARPALALHSTFCTPRESAADWPRARSRAQRLRRSDHEPGVNPTTRKRTVIYRRCYSPQSVVLARSPRATYLTCLCSATRRSGECSSRAQVDGSTTSERARPMLTGPANDAKVMQ